MTEEPPCPLQPPSPAEGDHRLDSWKEIAAYFDRRVRTVQRWEKSEELPVHRLHHEKGSSVYAYASELEEWVLRRSAPPAPEESEAPAPAASASRRVSRSGKPLLRAAAVLFICVLAACTTFAVNRALWRNHGLPLPPRTDKIVLAIVPFEDLSPRPGFEHLSAGLTEEVVTGAAEACPERVRFVGRVAVERIEARLRPSEIARELEIDYLVGGYVQRGDERVRVTVRVLDARRETFVWTASVESRVEEPLALQEELAGRIVELLRDKVFRIL